MYNSSVIYTNIHIDDVIIQEWYRLPPILMPLKLSHATLNEKSDIVYVHTLTRLFF